MIARGVTDLRGARGPSAVGGFIVTVIVDAIERVSGWARSHISAERGEILPAFTYPNAAPAVPLVTACGGSFTSPMHRAPGAKFARLVVSRGFSMLRVLVRHQFTTQTAATLTGSGAQIRGVHFHDCTALTAAPPDDAMGLLSVGARDHREAAEYLPNQINHQIMRSRGVRKVQP